MYQLQFLLLLCSLFHHALQSILCRASRRIFEKGKSDHVILSPKPSFAHRIKLSSFCGLQGPHHPAPSNSQVSSLPLTLPSLLTRQPHMPSPPLDYLPASGPSHPLLSVQDYFPPDPHTAVPASHHLGLGKCPPLSRSSLTLQFDQPPPSPASSTLHGLTCFVCTTLMLPGFPSSVHLFILSRWECQLCKAGALVCL